jgi:hypothetical protein
MNNVVTDLLGKKVTITSTRYNREHKHVSVISGVVRAVAHSSTGYSLIVQAEGERAKLVIVDFDIGVEVVVDIEAIRNDEATR